MERNRRFNKGVKRNDKEPLKLCILRGSESESSRDCQVEITFQTDGKGTIADVGKKGKEVRLRFPKTVSPQRNCHGGRRPDEELRGRCKQSCCESKGASASKETEYYTVNLKAQECPSLIDCLRRTLKKRGEVLRVSSLSPIRKDNSADSDSSTKESDNCRRGRENKGLHERRRRRRMVSKKRIEKPSGPRTSAAGLRRLKLCFDCANKLKKEFGGNHSSSEDESEMSLTALIGRRNDPCPLGLGPECDKHCPIARPKRAEKGTSPIDDRFSTEDSNRDKWCRQCQGHHSEPKTPSLFICHLCSKQKDFREGYEPGERKSPEDLLKSMSRERDEDVTYLPENFTQGGAILKLEQVIGRRGSGDYRKEDKMSRKSRISTSTKKDFCKNADCSHSLL